MTDRTLPTAAGFGERLFPELSEPEARRRFRLFRILLYCQLGALVLFTTTALGDSTVVISAFNILVASIVAAVLFVLAFLLARKGRIHAGATLSVVMNIALVAYNTAIFGTRDYTVFIFSLPIMMSAILLETSLVFMIATLASLTYGGLTFVEYQQLLPIPYTNVAAMYPMDWHRSNDTTMIQKLVVDGATVIVVYFITAVLAVVSSRSLQNVTSRLVAAFESRAALQSDRVAIADQLGQEARTIAASTEQQLGGASEQSRVAEQVAGDLEALSDAAREIAGRAADVAHNAQETLGSQQLVVDRIALLSSRVQRVGEILEATRSIADKSDLLALNAAIEGTKAGEVGRGFTLVASQIRKLAEETMTSVENIRDLTNDINDVFNTVIVATTRESKLVSKTAELTREINTFVHEQNLGTERASQAMQEIASAARQTAQGTGVIIDATRSLGELSKKMQLVAPDDEPMY